MQIRVHHILITCVVGLAAVWYFVSVRPTKSWAGCSGFVGCVGALVQRPVQTLQDAGDSTKKAIQLGNNGITNSLEHWNQQGTNFTTKLNTEGTNGAKDVNSWVTKHPSEVATLAVLGLTVWAVCAEGCTLLAEGSIAGVPLAAGSANLTAQPQQSEHDPNTSGSAPSETNTAPQLDDSGPIASDDPKAVQSGGVEVEPEVAAAEISENERRFLAGLEQEWPGRYSRKDFPSGPDGSKDDPNVPKIDPIIRYKSLDQRPDMLNTFAYPVLPVLFRTADPQDKDPAGGEMFSPRKLLSHSENADIDAEAISLWGEDARRVHGSLDLLAWPGQPAVATMTGTIEYVGPMKSEPPLHMIVIRSPDNTLHARELYVLPDTKLKAGTPVTAGVTVVGHVEVLDHYPPYKDVPNHIHTDIVDNLGRHIDPWTNRAVDERRVNQRAR